MRYFHEPQGVLEETGLFGEVERWLIVQAGGEKVVWVCFAVRVGGAGRIRGNQQFAPADNLQT